MIKSQWDSMGLKFIQCDNGDKDPSELDPGYCVWSFSGFKVIIIIIIILFVINYY